MPYPIAPRHTVLTYYIQYKERTELETIDTQPYNPHPRLEIAIMAYKEFGQNVNFKNHLRILSLCR